MLPVLDGRQMVPLDPWDLRVQEVPRVQRDHLVLVHLKRARERLVLPEGLVDQQMVLLVRLIRDHPHYIVARWHLVVLLGQLDRYHQ